MKHSSLPAWIDKDKNYQPAYKKEPDPKNIDDFFVYVL